MIKPFIVAEISANHLGSFNRAKVLIDEAKNCGADAVKFQTYRPDDMVINDYILAQGPWKGRSLLSLYKEAALPYEWHAELFDHARALGLSPFSSPFSASGVDFLETLDCSIYKIASFELIDTPLIRKVAQTGKRIIMSTGMASEEEIETAVKEAKKYGPRDITLLKCTSSYPSTAEDAHLNTMSHMYFRFGTHVGVSDHTLGIGVACAAAGLGASVIEKHLTLKREDGGLDAGFSLEPHEFSQMVEECDKAYASRGKIKYGSTKNDSTYLRRSLYFNQDLKAGTRLEEAHFRTARPYAVVSPQEVDKFIGHVIVKDVKYGEPVTWESVYAGHDTKQ